MNKCFVKVFTTTFCILLSLSLCFSFPVSADVFVPDVNILVRADASTSSYDYPFVILEENTFVLVANSGSVKLNSSTVQISFFSSSFVPGVEYHFQFVIASPNAPISVSSGSVAGSFIPSSGAAKDLIWGTDINFGLVDVQTYPDPFNSSGSFDYASESYFISGSFVPNDDSGIMSVDINFSGDTYIFQSGYAYMSFSATDEAYNQGLLNNIYLTVNNIFSSMVSGFTTLNNSISSFSRSVSSSLSNIELQMGSITSKLDDILTALGSDSGDGSINSGKLEQSTENINNANDSVKDDISNIIDNQDKIESDLESDNAAVDNFLGDFSSDPNTIISNIHSTVNSISSGVDWVASFFGVCLSFEPLYQIFFVASFMHILFLVLNVSFYGISRFGYRSRLEERREQYIEESKARTQYYKSLYDQRHRLNDHYGFTE